MTTRASVYGKQQRQVKTGSISKRTQGVSTGVGHGADVMALQRRAGNQAVNQLMSSRGRRLPSSADSIPPIENVLKSDGGQPIDSSTQRFMESRFGNNFSQVRVHISSQAASSARALDAAAYTVGKNVVFANGAYEPQSEAGKELLAHELTHVVQQKGVSPQTETRISQPGEPSEREADQISSKIHATPVSVGQMVPVGQIQRIGLNDAKELWKKHVKPRIKGKDEKDDSTDTEESWKDPHEEVITHTKQAFDIGTMFLEKLRDDILRKGGSTEELREMNEKIEGLKKSQELFETGAKTFEKGVKTVELAKELSEFNDALEKVNSIGDPRANEQSQMQALRAYDDLFATSGNLFKHLPDGPWQAYGEFLTHFKDNGGFFYNMGQKLGQNARKADHLEDVEPQEQPKAAAVRISTIEDVALDVEKKFNLVVDTPLLARGGREDYERFKSTHEKFLTIFKKAEGNWFQQKFPRFRKKDPVLEEEMKAAAQEEYDALRTLHIALTMNLTMNQGETIDTSLAPDLDFIKQYTGE